MAGISIHAPREGGDVGRPALEGCHRISIHAPREGGDRQGNDIYSLCGNFNPRPPRGGDAIPDLPLDGTIISIHAPREGATR